jgi:hypothetical protein
MPSLVLESLTRGDVSPKTVSSCSSTSAGATACANVNASASPSSGDALAALLHVRLGFHHQQIGPVDGTPAEFLVSSCFSTSAGPLPVRSLNGTGTATVCHNGSILVKISGNGHAAGPFTPSTFSPEYGSFSHHIRSAFPTV